jgi:hypothetical protein
VILKPLNQAPIGNRGALVAKSALVRRVRANGSSHDRARRRTADRVIPGDAVIVHEVIERPLVPADQARLAAGDGFVTPDPKVFVRVAAIDACSTRHRQNWDLPAGCLRKEDLKLKVYLIENNTKRWVTSPQVLTGLGKSWADEVRPRWRVDWHS